MASEAPSSISLLDRAASALSALSGFEVRREEPLSRHARFGLGGPAAVFAECASSESFQRGVEAVRRIGAPHVVIGEGTNLIADDEGYRGVVLRFRGRTIACSGERITVESGAELQALVDASIEAGLEGLHTMTRIPGWVGAAIYGNAGAYGHSIQEFVERVHFLDDGAVKAITTAECRFAYRHSIFKEHKDWIVLSAELRLPPGERETLRQRAAEIREIRDAKYPPTMRCAGSIFKNLIAAELPASVRDQTPSSKIIEGKVPAAWFLEEVGAKGMRRGDIQVASYHANLIYNDGRGSSADFRAIVTDLKQRVQARFGLQLEEEVQYLP